MNIKNKYYSIKRFIKDIPWKAKQIKFFFQRGKRGWADCDWWEMHSYLVRIILPMLKQLKEHNHGYPCNLTEEKWENILAEMIEGFEAANRVCADEYLDKVQPGWFEEMDKISDFRDKFNSNIIKKESMIECGKLITEDMKLFELKMKLFIKHFFSLWD